MTNLVDQTRHVGMESKMHSSSWRRKIEDHSVVIGYHSAWERREFMSGILHSVGTNSLAVHDMGYQ